MATNKVYPYGLVDVTVPAGEYITVATFGSDYATIYYGTASPNFPTTYYIQQQLDNDEVTLGAMTVDQPVRIAARADIVFYDYGAAPVLEYPTMGLIKLRQAAATDFTGATVNLEAADLIAGICTVDGGAASTVNTPTGAQLDAALPNFGESDAFDFCLINISTTAGETATLTADTGVSIVGNAVVAEADAETNATSAIFRCRRTATAATWVFYRISS